MSAERPSLVLHNRSSRMKSHSHHLVKNWLRNSQCSTLIFRAVTYCNEHTSLGDLGNRFSQYQLDFWIYRMLRISWCWGIVSRISNIFQLVHLLPHTLRMHPYCHTHKQLSLKSYIELSGIPNPDGKALGNGARIFSFYCISSRSYAPNSRDNLQEASKLLGIYGRTLRFCCKVLCKQQSLSKDR